MNLKRRQVILAALAFACLGMRALVPAGYMPGNLLGGEFMVLCPSGLPEAAAARFTQGHSHHKATLSDIGQVCPIGNALQPAWLPTDAISFEAPEPVAVLATSLTIRSFRSPPRRGFQPRAPPEV